MLEALESSCSLPRTMDGRMLRRGIISSCQSAATFEIEKRFWPRVSHIVSSAISSTGLCLYLYFYLYKSRLTVLGSVGFD